ncbi:hypothetical protein CP965_08000 [Halarcobacter mediterraneus]|uniref:histidine kinase n=2 Tax=Halarcobacter mediterraneus TaxID=2023153 RepID=A0A4Q1ATI7_9BACT|nr:hypothetical protein CP965_08000 [Halarcobacter mediterraneus]
MMISLIEKFKNSIGYILFKKVYLTYFVFMFLFVSFQIFTEYRNEKKQITKIFQKIENVYKNILIENVKQRNINALINLANAIESTTDITGISIINEKRSFIFLDGVVSEDIKNLEPIIRLEGLTYAYSNNLLTHTIEFKLKEQNYYIFLFIDLNEVYINLEESIFLILLNIIASMILLGVLFFIFSSKHLIRPLNTIIAATKKFDVVEHETIEIDLKEIEKNELHKLAGTFNKMSKRINEAYINMQQLTMIREIQKNKLEQQKKELQDANKAKDDFMANMSHELKTPLNSINVISNVMMKNRRGVFDEKEIKNFEIINKCGKDLLFLINDVLDLSKLEAGEIILNNDRVDIKDIGDSIYDMFIEQMNEKNLDFIYEVDESIGYIFSDKDRIKQIAKNLLSNSLKFTEKGKIKFIIRNDDENIKMIIEDQGIGIAKEKLSHIFDRFKQVDGSTTRKYGGTGLGLAICKDLSKLLKGDISVTSEENVGSRFIVTISKNKELLKGLDTLELKADSKDKKEDIEEVLMENQIEILDEEKKEIYILNNDPILFFNLIIQLNKKYLVKQVSSFEEFKKFKDKESKILIDISKLNEEEKEFLVDEFKGELIVIYENNLENDIKEKAIKTYEKTLIKDGLKDI